MARVPRLLTRVAAAVAALMLMLVLAFPAGARADSDAGWAYIPNTGSAPIPGTGPAPIPGTEPASIPGTGPASMTDTGPAYVPNVDPAYVPYMDPGYVPNARPAPIPNADSRYIYVSKQSPERLYLIGGGRIIFQSPVNTGIRAAPTPDGVFRIFASYLQKTMKGTDPRTFRRYNDRDVPYVMYFNGGLAIHGFRRSGYGYPQSFGCVELPVYKARELYGLLQGGSDTKVVVTQRRPVFERGRAASGEDRLGRYSSQARG